MTKIDPPKGPRADKDETHHRVVVDAQTPRLSWPGDPSMSRVGHEAKRLHGPAERSLE